MIGFNDDNRSSNSTFLRTTIAMGSMILLILAAVVVLNKKGDPGKKTDKAPAHSNISVDSGKDGNAQQTEAPQNVPTYGGDGRVSDDLDIWDEDYAEILKITPTPSAGAGNEGKDKDYRTLVTYADGSEEWVAVSSLLKKNTYKTAGFSYRRPLMSYYEEDVKISRTGAMISVQQNYVDYIKLKKAGVEFVMICAGERGEDGELRSDPAFAQNLKDASDAGLGVGIWFFSSAVTVEEAKEEAAAVIARLEDQHITYPVAFVMKDGAEDERDRELSRSGRTEAALAFCREIETAGYRPILGANKEYLIKKFDLTKLVQIDTWLMECGDLPDYPYEFAMWSYSASETIEGIAGEAALCISFENWKK